jgi:hypothetical protein
MDEAQIAAIVATAAAVTTCVDKIIQIYWPNSRVNSIFDILAKFVYQAVNQISPSKKQ